MSNDRADADLAVIGLGVMGANLARNLDRHDYRVTVHDIDRTRVRALAGENSRFIPAVDLRGLVTALTRPRKLILLVPAGAATDAAIGAVLHLLEAGDVVIDGGNAQFSDTVRREAEAVRRGVQFVGAGVSGGELGALRGPCFTVGATREAYARVRPILSSIAATVDGRPCCLHVGSAPAGHFVKAIHNGIEYAVMQLIAEAYDLLRNVVGLTSCGVAELFAEWNGVELDSYLMEISAEIAGHVDHHSGKPFLDVIDDRADQLGTGRWTVQEALALDVPAAAIGEAVFARSLSKRVPQRVAVRERLGAAPVVGTGNLVAEEIRQGLHGAIIAVYAQGFDTIDAAVGHYGWMIDRAELAEVWRGGCVIRARLLERIRDAFLADDGLVSLLADRELASTLRSVLPGWRRTAAAATLAGVPVPALTSALGYLDALRAGTLSTALVQAQRDYMGAHAYRRTDRDGVFHTRWDTNRAEVRVHR